MALATPRSPSAEACANACYTHSTKCQIPSSKYICQIFKAFALPFRGLCPYFLRPLHTRFKASGTKQGLGLTKGGLGSPGLNQPQNGLPSTKKHTHTACAGRVRPETEEIAAFQGAVFFPEQPDKLTSGAQILVFPFQVSRKTVKRPPT